ncbi:MAG: hypothetical protein KatS3mg096_770 [Candidatus Parcubacteria bacterium]|nr:MAG: hypothetical protein KatS3mg096_770 [Candidatus Parcubacteria bacterium]
MDYQSLQVIERLTGLALVGLFLWIVVKPLLDKFVFKKDKNFENFLNNDFHHFQQEINERLREFNERITRLEDRQTNLESRIGYLEGFLNRQGRH